MSFDHLPANIEKSVRHFAERMHISQDEAVVKLIETGLTVVQPEGKPALRGQKTVIPGLPDEPLNTEDAAVFDEAMDIVMQARRERSRRIAGA